MIMVVNVCFFSLYLAAIHVFELVGEYFTHRTNISDRSTWRMTIIDEKSKYTTEDSDYIGPIE